MLTSDQLRRLHFSNLRIAQRRLALLNELRVLDRFRPPWRRGEGSTQHHWVLDEAGAPIAADWLDTQREDLAWRRDTSLALARSTKLTHQLDVNEFFSRLAEEARVLRGGLREWWGERRCQQALQGPRRLRPNRAPGPATARLPARTGPRNRRSQTPPRKTRRYTKALPRRHLRDRNLVVILAVPSQPRASRAAELLAQCAVPIVPLVGREPWRISPRDGCGRQRRVPVPLTATLCSTGRFVPRRGAWRLRLVPEVARRRPNGLPLSEEPQTSRLLSGRALNAPASTSGTDATAPSQTATPPRCCPRSPAGRSRPTANPATSSSTRWCGIGTTLVEAIHTGRRGIGVELEPRWAKLAQRNIAFAVEHRATGQANVVRGDARELPHLLSHHRHLLGKRQANRKLARLPVGAVDLVLLSPPYACEVGETSKRRSGRLCIEDSRNYSRDRRNLGHARGDHYAEAMAPIYDACAAVLKPGGFLVAVTKGMRTSGALRDLAGLTVAFCDAAGLLYWQHVIALLATLRDDQLIPRASFWQLLQTRRALEQGERTHLVCHEDVLVFRKPSVEQTEIQRSSRAVQS